MKHAPNFRIAIGSEAWWQQIASRGTPLIERLHNGYCRVTFYWRQPQDCAIQTVYIDCWSLTPHPVEAPTAMLRIPASDVWYWEVCLPETWQGSYFFIPVVDGDGFPVHHEQRRAWWINAIALFGEADPFNPLPSYTSGSHALSRLLIKPSVCSLASETRSAALADDGLHVAHWHSHCLDNQRRVWQLRCGDADGAQADLPLLIFLDGAIWAEQLPVANWLREQTDAGLLPAARYVFIEALDSRTRADELTCNPTFWLAVLLELLPQLNWQGKITPLTLLNHRNAEALRAVAQANTPFPDEPLPAITTASCALGITVIGQSFGGLAACYAGLLFPDAVSRVISQSGSFWWQSPQGARLDQFAATSRAETGPARTGEVQFLLQAGRFESDMRCESQRMSAALSASGYTTHYQEFEGGHDWLCWREALLTALPQPYPAATRHQCEGVFHVDVQ